MAKLLAVKKLLLLAALCLVAYAPALNLPLMEDDFPNISQALAFGSPLAPLANPVFRLRTTSYWAMLALYRNFHVAPVPYHIASLLLHIANTWLLYFALLGWPRTRAAAIWAAGFFAVHEGHQEAVMWFSAINELLQFFFGGLALVLYMRGRRWLAPSLACFALALVSKESAVIFVAFFAVAMWRTPPPAKLFTWTILPYLALAGLAAASVAATRSYSFRFADGSFSLSAPFWITWPRGFARLLWIWGWIALAILALKRRDAAIREAALSALTWTGIALLPYSFLTYSTQIPSRQTYLASAGLAVLFGLAMAQLFAQGARGRRFAAALAIAALLHNVGYLWIRKLPQFMVRAQPTEQLIRMARETHGPVWVQCFPQAQLTAREAIRLGAGLPPEQMIWSPREAEARKPAAVFCYPPKH
jgi:hypothetical protein